MTVLNGSARGLTTSGGKLLSRANLPGDPLSGGSFGSGMCGSGDLNDDGYADQVVIAQGFPHVTNVWGGKSGLSGGTRVRGIHPLSVSVAKAGVGDTGTPTSRSGPRERPEPTPLPSSARGP